MDRLARYQADLPTVHIAAGQVYMGAEELLVSTILGSCVSVCLFDRESATGAICHGALPHSRRDVGQEPLRYVDEAVFFLVERYRRLGVSPRSLDAKVFGGADVLGSEGATEYQSIGRQNMMAALESLSWYRIAPSARDAGGDRGRRLYFAPHTGEVFVKRLSRTIRPDGGGRGR